MLLTSQGSLKEAGAVLSPRVYNMRDSLTNQCCSHCSYPSKAKNIQFQSLGIYWLLDNSALSDRFPGVNQIMATMLYEQEQHRESNTPIKIALYVYVVVLNNIVLDRSLSCINSLTEIIGCG